MSWRSVLGWWVLAVILVAGLLAWERLRPASGAAAPNAPRAVFADPARDRTGLEGMPEWPAGAPATLVLQREGDPELRFERDGTGDGDGDGWRQVEPVPYPVETFSIERTIELVRALRARDVLPMQAGDDADASPALLGFDPPRARLTLRWPSAGGADSDASEDAAPELRLEVGRRGIGGRAYVRVSGDDRVLVVDAELHERAVSTDPREWRDRSIFGSVAVDTAASVDIAVGELRTRLVREDRRWRMESPYGTRVNALLLDELIGRLDSATVGGFVLDRPGQLDRFGLAPRAEADVRVTIAAPGREERSVRLRIGATAGAGTSDRYGLIDDRPVVVRVPGSLVQAIARRPEEWAEPTATGVQPADVGRMRLMRTDPPLEVILERDGAGWTMAVGEGRAAPGTARSVPSAAPGRLLDLLSDVRAPSVRPGTLPPTASTAVVLEDFSGRPLHTVRIAEGSGGSDRLWLMDAGDGLLRLYPGGIEPPLTPAAFDDVAAAGAVPASPPESPDPVDPSGE